MRAEIESGVRERFVESGAFLLFHFFGLENFTAIEAFHILSVTIFGD